MAKLLSKSDIVNLVDLKEAIDALESAFIDYSNNNAEMPMRSSLEAKQNNGLALIMPAYLKGMNAMGTKVVTVFEENPVNYNIPTIMGTILLFDDKTGTLLSVMDGGLLTSLRTGAVSGLATKFLSNKNSKVMALFGSGGMAQQQAEAILEVRDIERIYLYSIDPIEKRNSFMESLSKKIDAEILLAKSSEEACKNADIISLITTAKEPVINYKWLKPGVHINGIGSHKPTMREIDEETIINGTVICDSIAACKVEAGDLISPQEKGIWSWEKCYGELGEIVSKKKKGRSSEEEITIFKSVGLAIQDMAVAKLVYNNAVESNKGLEFNFE